jgi:hypothetical protein
MAAVCLLATCHKQAATGEQIFQRSPTTKLNSLLNHNKVKSRQKIKSSEHQEAGPVWLQHQASWLLTHANTYGSDGSPLQPQHGKNREKIAHMMEI